MESYSKSVELKESRRWTGNITSNYGFSLFTGGTVNFDESKSMSGYKNPLWKEQIKAHQDATTDFVGSERSFSAPTVTYWANRKFWDGSEEFDTLTDVLALHALAPNAVDNSYLPTVVARAKARFVNNIREVQTTFQGGVFLGELTETLRTLTNPAKSLRRGLSDYLKDLKRMRSRAPSSPKRRRKFVRDTWLEYAFGWAPLINDISAANDLLQSPGFQPNPYVKVTAEDSRKDLGPIVFVDEQSRYSSSLIVTRRSYQDETQTSVKLRGQVMAQVQNPLKRRLARVGLGPNDFLPTLWELVPWSFVVDYFTNIGDIVNAWSLLESNASWYNMTTRVVTTRETMVAPVQLVDAPPPNWTRSYVSGATTSAFAQIKSVNRSVPVTLVPDFRFELPGFGTKWINLAALSTQLARLRPY